jgi:hypothetical protein
LSACCPAVRRNMSRKGNCSGLRVCRILFQNPETGGDGTLSKLSPVPPPELPDDLPVQIHPVPASLHPTLPAGCLLIQI